MNKRFEEIARRKQTLVEKAATASEPREIGRWPWSMETLEDMPSASWKAASSARAGD